MKILFTVQGEGRGHLTQALTLRRRMAEEGHEVIGVVVGKSATRRLPDFFVSHIDAPLYPVESPNFLPPRKSNKPPLFRSIVYNFAHVARFRKGIMLIRRLSREADIVVNFYELLTGLAYAFRGLKTPLVCIGHQYLFFHPDFRFPKGCAGSVRLLKWYTRATAFGARRLLALSFTEMPSSGKRVHVVPPLLRESVLHAESRNGDYLHGYMLNAGFSRDVEAWHKEHPSVSLHFFWDRETPPEGLRIDDHLTFHGLDDEAFVHYMAGARAYATTAGFESVCEAMYLGKPVLMVPTHIEQRCNACDAERAGAGVSSETFDLDKLDALQPRDHSVFRLWVDSAPRLFLHHLTEVEKLYSRKEKKK